LLNELSSELRPVSTGPWRRCGHSSKD